MALNANNGHVQSAINFLIQNEQLPSLSPVNNNAQHSNATVEASASIQTQTDISDLNTSNLRLN